MKVRVLHLDATTEYGTANESWYDGGVSSWREFCLANADTLTVGEVRDIHAGLRGVGSVTLDYGVAGVVRLVAA